MDVLIVLEPFVENSVFSPLHVALHFWYKSIVHISVGLPMDSVLSTDLFVFMSVQWYFDYSSLIVILSVR